MKSMRKNPTLQATIIVHDFFKKRSIIDYSKISGRTYSCVKGTLRWYSLLEQMIPNNKLKKNSLSYILLLNASYQIKFLSFKDNLILSEVLNSCNILGLKNLRPYMYAVLKKLSCAKFKNLDISKQPEVLEQIIARECPNYFINIIINSEPSNCLTIYNYERFCELNVENKLFNTFKFSKNNNSVVIPEEILPHKLKGFSEGCYYIQNSVALGLIDLLQQYNKKIQILDACCGVGGKTFLLKNFYQDSCYLTSVDSSKKQIVKLEQNSRKLGITPDKIICQDILSLSGQYDLIVLDAPCTASGNIRKNPEIKFRINSEELNRITKLQAEILDHLWQQLCVGGVLIYMTCSIFKSENNEQINNFLSRTKYAEKVIEQQYCITEDKNGFFFCKINKLN